MNRYNILFYIGIVIVILTYLFIFILPGNRLSLYFESGYYFGIIPRIFPIFLIFGDVFVVVGLLFPSTNFNKRRIYLIFASSIFIIAGASMALTMHVSPIDISQYNGIRSGYLIVEGLSLLFFTMVIAYYISLDTKNTEAGVYTTHDK
jgi:hypothetical protein